MKILYASCRYDPLDRDAGSGVDFNIYDALRSNGVDLRIAGPYKDKPSVLEKIYRSAHRLFSRKLTAKFSDAYLRYSALEVEKTARVFQPDAIFTHNLIPLVYLKTNIPVIYKSDAILWNMHSQWPTYSRLELMRMLRWEEKALRVSSRIITASHWAESALIEHYKIPSDKILVLPIPSSLPSSEIPQFINHPELSRKELRLLAVAKDYHLKGVDIAEKAVQQLQSQGINARLRVAGQSGKDTEYVRFMGLFKKDDPLQRSDYLQQFQWADFLIHTARYEAAGIVCGEAAAFGVPTITNAIGGLATTVENNVSGIVLPALSPAEEYVKVIEHFLQEPFEYEQLRRSTRERYERELNWEAAGKKILAFSQKAVDENTRNPQSRGE